jgi:mRNA interferase MazF
VLVVQADTLLASNLATVAVVSLTSNLAAAKMPGNVLLPAEETGLPRDSVVNVTQLTTLNRYELENPPVGVLAAHLMHDVDAGLALALGLPPWQTRY